MKKLTALILTVLLALTVCSCSKDADTTTGAASENSTESGATAGGEEQTTLPAGAPTDAVTEMKEKFDTLEYSAYVNIFYENSASDYTDKTFTKEGTFAVLRDEYSQKYRYYVWGYADKTRCCDWQWEFVPEDTASLPAPGSYVKLTGKFVQDDNALDGYWFTDVTLETVEVFSGAAADYDLTTDSPTLARVQIANMQGHADKFDGKTVRVFGRALNTACIQHPYYDGSWTMDFQYDGAAPATGQYIMLDGVFTAEDSGSYIKASACKLFD